VDREGRTVLLLAVGTGDARIAKALLDAGDDEEAWEPSLGCTPLLVAGERILT